MINQLNQFKMQHVQQYLKIALQAFRQNNPDFKHELVKDVDFVFQTEALIRLLLQIETKFNQQNNTDVIFNTVFFENGKMIAAGFSCDLHYFVKHAYGKVNDQLLNELSKVNLSDFPLKSTIASMKGMVEKESQNKGIISRALYLKSVYMVSKNYINEFSLLINPFTIKFLKRFGTQIWNHTSLDLKGQIIPRYIVLRDMRVLAAYKNPNL